MFFFNSLNARNDHWRSDEIIYVIQNWWRQNFIPSSVIYMEILDSMRFWCKLENFAWSAQIWSQNIPLVLTKKTSTHTLCFWRWTTKLLGVESGQIMPQVRHCYWTTPDVNEPYAHRRCASNERLIFYNITRCYGKRVTEFSVAIAAGWYYTIID